MAALLGLTHDQLAARLRGAGLDMSRSAITALEGHGRKFSVGEFALLCLALEVTPQAMLDGEETVRVSKAEVELAALRRFFRATRVKGEVPKGFEPYWTNYRQELERQSARAAAELAIQVSRLPGARYPYVDRAATLSAEIKAAARLGISPRDVATESLLLWGQSLTDERDTRAATRLTEHMAERSARMVRARVTRQLEDELRANIEKGKH